MPSLPPRVWIVGPCGSGKSHVADLLARRRGVPAVHLDDLNYLPGNWEQVDRDELRTLIEGATRGDAWVVDGNYSSVSNPARRLADLVIWLDLPFWVTFPRVVRRTFRRALRGESCCNGNRERLSRAFLTRDSIFLWAITTHWRTRRRLTERVAPQPHVRLRTSREVREFLAVNTEP